MESLKMIAENTENFFDALNEVINSVPCFVDLNEQKELSRVGVTVRMRTEDFLSVRKKLEPFRAAAIKACS